jgi:hypothetical protein
MRRFGVKIGVAILVASTLGGLAVPTVASAKSKTTFKSADLSRYYKSAKSKTAFHFTTVRQGKQAMNLIILGDFGNQQPEVRYGVPTSSFKLSNKGKTLSVKYRPLTYKMVNKKATLSIGKTTYKFKMTKKSATKVTTKLTNGSRRLGSSGKSYTYTLTKSNPAKSYANTYSQPIFRKAAEAAMDQAILTAGATNLTAEQKASLNKQVDQVTTQAVDTIITNFNIKN